MARPSLDEVMVGIAMCLAHRATCAKLAVGCVLTDSVGRIIGSGYNGVPRGCTHCIDAPCPGASAPKGADLCQAVHAESNALLSCRDPQQIVTCYTTHAPCLRCVKTLMNTGCTSILFHYPDFEPAAKELWVNSGRFWGQIA